ncbi:MAG: glycosyltransferase family 2 protein [Caldilineaceae bacterium]|nr:glycosyltransferase family 2 protein [Caldilineaceae bacterium]
MTPEATPRVSVVMAAYNVAAYVKAAVNSVLQQTYTDFEFVIIDDGSTDGTWGVLENLAAQDKRVLLVRNPNNLGIARTRNRGNAIARGEFIAIMDSDDWCPTDRLEKQVAYLDTHSDVGVVGGQMVVYFDKEGRYSLAEPFPLTPGESAWHLHFVPPVMHPTVMMRRSLLANKGYQPEYAPVEECELWQRLKYATKFANIPDVVLFYRRHDTNITRDGERLRHMAALAARQSVEATLATEVPLEQVMVMMRYRRAEPDQVAVVSRRLYELAMRFRQSTSLTRHEWQLVKQDAASRIVRAARRQTPWSRSGAEALIYAARLDVVCAVRWVLSTMKKSAHYRWTAGLRLVQRGRTR